MSVTFPVDSVNSSKNLSTNTTPLDSIKAISGIRPEAFGSEYSNLINPIVNNIPGRNSGNAKMNGFLRAIHEAYSNHYPLLLSPDDVWLAIAQGFSYHVNANAEKLRTSFVKHEGKETIKVIRNGFVKGSADNDWQGCFSEFSDCISEYIGKDKRDLLVSDFSTSKSLHRAVSEVTMMNTLKKWFSYVVLTKCGIPNITLDGNKEDWERIIWKSNNLKQFQCEDWISNLISVLNNFVIAFDGIADPSFWTNIYKIEGPRGSGGTTVSGWVNVFFPYINSWNSPGKFDLPNELAIHSDSYGISPDNYPLGITSTPFVWEYFQTNLKMQFLAGFIGTTQNDLVVRPVQGWGVAEE